LSRSGSSLSRGALSSATVAPVNVQASWVQVASSLTVSLTLDSDPTPGHLLLAVVTSSGSITGPVSPWGSQPDVTAANGAVVYVYSRIAQSGDSRTIEFTATTARSFGLGVVEVAPGTGRSWRSFDQSSSGSGTLVATQATGSTPAQRQDDNFAVAGIAVSGTTGSTPTLSDSYTLLTGADANSRGFAGYKVLADTSATQTTGSWTTLRNSAGLVATYRQQNAAAVGPNPEDCTAGDPCTVLLGDNTVALTDELDAALVFGVGLCVALLASLLVTTWGNSGD